MVRPVYRTQALCDRLIAIAMPETFMRETASGHGWVGMARDGIVRAVCQNDVMPGIEELPMPTPTLPLTPDELLTTTRSVRKRLDFSRPVEPEIIRECLEIALQAPNGGNRQPWSFVIVTDAAKRSALGDIYRRGWALYKGLPINAPDRLSPDPERAATQLRILSS